MKNWYKLLSMVLYTTLQPTENSTNNTVCPLITMTYKRAMMRVVAGKLLQIGKGPAICSGQCGSVPGLGMKEVQVHTAENLNVK